MSPGTASIAVVVVNWNTWRLCLDCLESLRQSVDSSWHLYLVDNASHDDSSKHLKDLGDDVTFVQSKVNGGWTGGNNLGLKKAIEDGYSVFFVLNSDAMVEPSTLSSLSAVIQRDHSVIVGPLQIDPDGENYNFTGSCVRQDNGMPSYPSRVSKEDFSAHPLPALTETAYIQGSGIFFTLSQFRQVGPFDDLFYLNYDDTDWCFRARKLGFKVAMDTQSSIRHESSGSIGGGDSPLNTYFLTRNSLLFSRRHGTTVQRVRWFRQLIANEAQSTQKSSRFGKLLSLIRGTSLRQQAFRLGLRDYLKNSFGDCPEEVRALQKRFRETKT